MVYLADVNFVIALLDASHAHSRHAVTWLDDQEDVEILLCRVVQMGVLRILTNPAWLKENVKPAAAVWEVWDRLLEDVRFVEVEEPPGLEDQWRRITEPLEAGRCAETDCYLAAFALAGGYQLLTFDRGFRRFPGLKLLLLR